MDRTVRVLCSTRRHPFSYLIRFVNFSLFSHEAIVDGDHVIEALGKFPSHAPGEPWNGVRRAPMAEVLPEYLDYGVVEFDIPDHTSDEEIAAAWQWLRQQIGKHYDYPAIGWQFFGRVLTLFGFRRDWQREDKWICFELRRGFFDRLGIMVERSDGASMSSRDCWWSPMARVVTWPRTISATYKGGV